MNGYKIVRITSLFHQQALGDIYRANPDLKLQSYDYQIKEIFNRSPIYSDSFSKAMRALGVDAHEIIMNAASAQEMWAKERGIKLGNHPQRWADIVLRQIMELKPDVVYYQASCYFNDHVRRTIRRKLPFVKLFVLYSGGYHKPEHFGRGDLDIVIACVPFLKRHYEKYFKPVSLVYHGFDDSVLAKFDDIPEVKKHDISFLGTTGPQFNAITNKHYLMEWYKSRYDTLTKLILELDLRIWEFIYPPEFYYDRTSPVTDTFIRSLPAINGHFTDSHEAAIRKIDSMIKDVRSELARQYLVSLKNHIKLKAESHRLNNDKGSVEVEPFRSRFPKQCFAPVFGLDLFKVLAQSKISFNSHIDLVTRSAGNMRMFEATGMGSMLLTNEADNIDDLFEDGREVVCYSSDEDCLEKAKYLLDHEDELKNIAEAGRRRTLQDHTIQKRCEQIHSIIVEKLKGGRKSKNQLVHEESKSDVVFTIAISDETDLDDYLLYSLPSQLAPGNIIALRGKEGVLYKVFISAILKRRLLSDKSFNVLRKSVDLEIIEFAADDRTDMISKAFFEALESAASRRAAMVLLDPGMVISDGALYSIYKLSRDERKYMIIIPDLIVNDSVKEKLNALKDNSGALSLSPVALSALAKDSLMEKSKGCLTRSVGENGFLIRTECWRPLMIWARAYVQLIKTNYDFGSSLAKLCYLSTPLAQEIHVNDDSNEMIALQLSGGQHDLLAEECEARENATEFLHLQYKLRADGNDSQWEEAKRLSDNGLDIYLEERKKENEERDARLFEQRLEGIF